MAEYADYRQSRAMDPLTKEACSSGIRVRVQGQHADPHGENDINIVYLANSDLTLRELCNRPTSRMGSNLEKTNMSRDNSVKTSLYVRLEAKPGKEKEVASFLEDGLALANKEPKTIATGQAPHRYLLELRLRKAQSMVANHSLHFDRNRCCLRLSSHAHLSTAFRSRFGQIENGTFLKATALPGLHAWARCIVRVVPNGRLQDDGERRHRRCGAAAEFETTNLVSRLLLFSDINNASSI